MRGTYAATYLERLASGFALRRGIAGIDLGAAFDLIVGTSTGGIIGCALAAGLQLPEVVELYRKHGAAIFRRRLPENAGLGLAIDLVRRPELLRLAPNRYDPRSQRVSIRRLWANYISAAE